MPKHVVEALGDEWSRPENIVVNGAFKVSEWTIGEKLTVTKNPGFYDAANVSLDAVSFYPIEEASQELNLFREGQLDVTSSIPPGDAMYALADEFGDDVECIATGDPGTTGNFEVVLEGKLIHSKTTMGHGKCTTAAEIQAVVDAVQAVIDSK